jgi:lactoylglutathione lyase
MRASTLLAFVAGASACSPPPATNTSVFPHTIRGPDVYPDPETLGYQINHLSLSVKNLTRAVDFYTSVFGLRHMFTAQLTPSVSFTYLGHSAGGKNGTGWQSTEELVRTKNNAQGLLELQFFDDPATIRNLTASTEVTNTFSHIGIVVPDLAKTLARLQRLNVNILHKPGDIPEPGGVLARAVGLGNLGPDHPETAAFFKAWAGLTQGLIFCVDPDGNLIELQPLVEPVAF